MTNTARVIPSFFRKSHSQLVFSKMQKTTTLSVYIPVEPEESKIDLIIRLNALLKKIEPVLSKRISKDDCQYYIRSIKKYIHAMDHKNSPAGIAIFKHRNAIYSYHLPIKPPKLAIVGKGFYLKPLIKSLELWENFRILTLSDNRLTLYKFDSFNIVPIKTFQLNSKPGAQSNLEIHLSTMNQAQTISKLEAKKIAYQLVFEQDIDQNKLILLGPSEQRYYIENALKNYAMIDVCMKGELDSSIEEVRDQVIRNLLPQNEISLALDVEHDLESDVEEFDIEKSDTVLPFKPPQVRCS